MQLRSHTALRATRRADDIEFYRVQPKDTLYDIAERYLIHSGNWKALQRGNRVA
ncbi:LysM peptidoglycan-binding domain-containing protein [Mycetohabitans endofungorum]|uniref:LysM peptidoglycan-binding domain-containing protein n=1 Tax=Mycetohabitans sp. B5 TaxID=2841846 RepID=UPI0011B07A22